MHETPRCFSDLLIAQPIKAFHRPLELAMQPAGKESTIRVRRLVQTNHSESVSVIDVVRFPLHGLTDFHLSIDVRRGG